MPGSFQSSQKPLKSRNLSECISIASFEEGFVINKDGSLSAGFEATLPEEETRNADQFQSLILELSTAIKQLPTGTVMQQLDIYWKDTFQVDVPSEAPFFHQKTLDHHQGRQVLKHRCVLFLRFFNVSYTPSNTFLALGSGIEKTPFEHLEARHQEATRAYKEFLAALPHGISLRKLSDQEQEQLVYQYLSLTFHRQPLGFECDMVMLPDSLYLGTHLKSVVMKGQSESVTSSSQNAFGSHGVTSPFLWRLGHHARFPHIVCQSIVLMDDQQFRKQKGRELEYSAQLKLQPSHRLLATHLHNQFLELSQRLHEEDTRLVQFDLHVLAWHTDRELLQSRVDYFKSALGKSGIEAAEETEDTDNTFLSYLPGGTGCLEGYYMPLETAVAHLNGHTTKRGDTEGILLQDRHGDPLCYDPFKYRLDNQHVFVFGPSGSGKSFFNGKMIKDRYYAGHTMIVIDSGGTYRFLFEALGGKYIEYNPETPLRLNPFLIKKKEGKYVPDTDKVAFLIHFLAKMWKGDLVQNPLSEVEYALLSKFLTCYYQSLSADDIPHLIGFCDWLKVHLQQEKIEADLFDARNFFIVLEPFTEGIYQDHFNALEVEHLEDSRLLCFELEAVKNDKKLYPLVVQVLFDYVMQMVATQPHQKKFIDIEEGWTMLDDASESYIESFFRKGRKTNTAIRIITQNIDEIKHSSIAGAMRNNAATFMLLYNDKESVREEIAQFLGMNALDQEKYASLRRRDQYQDGYREVFIKEMDQSSVWRVGLSLYEHGLLTSRPDERHAIRELRQQGKDIQEAILTWVRGIQATQQ